MVLGAAGSSLMTLPIFGPEGLRLASAGFPIFGVQRVGRSGHAVGGLPKGRLFPVSRDDLVECTALLDAVRREELDCLVIPPKPLDVLAQQVAAEVACGEWDEEELYNLMRRAWPYRELTREEYGEVLQMLAEGPIRLIPPSPTQSWTNSTNWFG